MDIRSFPLAVGVVAVLAFGSFGVEKSPVPEPAALEKAEGTTFFVVELVEINGCGKPAE